MTTAPDFDFETVSLDWLQSKPGAKWNRTHNAIVPQGAFYCYPNFSSLLGRPLGPNGTVSANTLELADAILGEAKVAFVPGEAFGTPGYARFSFAMADADMEEGIRRIQQWVTA